MTGRRWKGVYKVSPRKSTILFLEPNDCIVSVGRRKTRIVIRQATKLYKNPIT